MTLASAATQDGPVAPARVAIARVLRVGLGYEWRRTDLGLLLRADYLRERSDEYTAEIVVEATLPGIPPHLHQARINLTSTRTRNELGRHLSRLTPGLSDADWGQLIELFCTAVLRLERQGQPVVYVGRLPTRVLARDLIEQLLPTAKETIWYGPGGVGKGWLAALASVCHNLGLPFAGLQVQPGRTLYLDWEDCEETLDERVQAVAAGLNVDVPEIAYRRCRRALARDLHEISRYVQETGADLVIVDSVGRALGTAGERNYEDMAIGLFESLRELGPITKLLIDHVAGASVGSSRVAGRPFGSAYKLYEARAAWEVRSEQEPGSTDSQIGLYHTKYNHSQRYRPLGFRLEFAPTDPGEPPLWVRIRRTDLADSAELSQNLSIPDRLAHELRAGARTYAELYDALSDLGEPQIRMAIKRGFGKRFIRLQNGAVGLLQEGSEPSE